MAAPTAEQISSSPLHLGGITRVCFSPDGQTIFTGGTDCLVRIHKADDPDSEPGFHDNHTDAVTSMSCSSSNLVTSSLDNIVRVFSYPQNDFQGFITRSSGVPVRWVSIDPSGERVVVCSDDMLVKVVHVKDTSRVSLLSDSTKAVRSASWDPTGKYLVTVSCDGKLRIYDMAGPSPLLLKILDGIVGPSEPDSKTSLYLIWHPSGDYFVLPTRTNEIGVVNREGWSRQAAFSPGADRRVMTGELSWSANGKYLASAAGTHVYIWDFANRELIAKYESPDDAISGLAFSPKENLLTFTTLDGSFVRWKDAVPSQYPDPVISDAVNAKNLDKLLDDEFGDDLDDDLEEKGDDVDDLFGEAGDDWIEDDIGAYGEEDGEKTRGGRTEVVNVTKAQDAFAPGSTQWKNKKRYLGEYFTLANGSITNTVVAFNMIGVVDVSDQESHNVVNVEFHDKSARRGYHFQDHNKYTMASLGEHGIAYAAPSHDGQPSTVYYRPYDSWASQSDWTVSLLPDENALCVASGGGGSDGTGMSNVVVATSKGYVRFLSSSGIQRYVWRIGEDAVTMAAGQDLVIVVTREGGTSLDGCQNLRYSLIDLNTFELVQEGRVPLPRKVTLSWVGFTSEGIPAIYDSTGLASILDRYRRPGNQARWVPILDSKSLKKEGRTERHWPVGVSATHLSCVILKGSDKEPWFPRPLIQQVELQMPLLNLDNPQGKLEEIAVRGEIQLSNMTDSLARADDVSDVELLIKQQEVALDRELLKLIQGACKADNLQRALDLARLMHTASAVEQAAKLANFYHLPGLEERIHSVKSDVDFKKMKEKRQRRIESSSTTSYASPSISGRNGNAKSSKPFSDFAPKQTIRRSFGGVQRDSTPAGTNRSESYVPETPQHEASGYDLPSTGATPVGDADVDMPISNGSPEGKRKRAEEPVEHFSVPKRKLDEFAVPSSGPKNPFAKKATPSANPFAKPAAAAKPLDAKKSTSFFDRVDHIESSGAPKSSAKAKANKKDQNAKPQQGKQTTLFNMKKGAPVAPAPAPRPAPPVHQESTETEGDDETGTIIEETLVDTPTGVLEESNVQETLSPEPMDVA